MKFLLFSLLLLSGVGLLDKCDKKKTDAGENVYALGDTLNLIRDEPLLLANEKLSLTFQDKAESRCPKYTNCIRAGEAFISILVDQESKQETVRLEAKGNCLTDHDNCGTAASALGYKVQLLNAYPYPGTQDADDNQKDLVRVIVTKGP